MSQLPEGRPPTVTQVRPGSRQPSTKSHFHAEPVFLVRQSTGSSSLLETSPVCKRGLGIRPFAHRSGIRALLREQQKQQEQQCSSPLVRSPNCHRKQDPGPSKQALPCASGSRPKGVFPSGGSSAVTFLHVLGRQSRGPCWHPQGNSTFDLKGMKWEWRSLTRLAYTPARIDTPWIVGVLCATHNYAFLHTYRTLFLASLPEQMEKVLPEYFFLPLFHQATDSLWERPQWSPLWVLSSIHLNACIYILSTILTCSTHTWTQDTHACTLTHNCGESCFSKRENCLDQETQERL